MAYRMHCDRCERYHQGRIPFKELEKLADSKMELLCTACKKFEEKCERILERIHDRSKQVLDEEVKKLREEAKAEIRITAQEIITLEGE